MENPWELGRTRHFHVHPDDDRYVRQHNQAAKQGKQVERALPPLPFLGDPRSARVILLGKNPNITPEDEVEADNLPELNDENMKALIFESTHPFFYFDERFEATTARTWWNSALKDMIAAAVEKSEGALSAGDVVGRIACLQSHPYRSRESFDPKPNEDFPTQNYTNYLAALAAQRKGVVFIVMGGRLAENRWRASVPSLPADIVRLRSVQKPWPTKGNMSAPDFERIIEALTQ